MGGIIGSATRVVGTAVGMIPIAAVVDGKGDAVTGKSDEVLRLAGTAVGMIGTTGVVVTVAVTVTVSTFCRRWALSGDESVRERRVVKNERIVRVCMVGGLVDGIFSETRRCNSCRLERQRDRRCKME